MFLMSWTEIVMSKPLFQKTFISGRPRVANSADIIKIATMFIKTSLIELKKAKNQNHRNYLLK